VDYCAAGVTDLLWDVKDLVALWEQYERKAERAAQVNPEKRWQRKDALLVTLGLLALIGFLGSVFSWFGKYPALNIALWISVLIGLILMLDAGERRD